MTNKILHENKWVSLMETPDGYVYSRETRCAGEIVAVLVYSMGEEMVLGRFERTPAHGPDIELCSITGGVEHGDPVATALHELKEEAGIDAVADELEHLGKVRPSKSADTWVHLFALDGTHKELGEAVGDGSAGEVDSYCKWITVEAAFACKDALMHSLLIRKMHHVNETRVDSRVDRLTIAQSPAEGA
jgi:hypothetical protein